MTYSIIGILAAIVLLICSRDVIWNKDRENEAAAVRSYRHFLLGVLGYLITDALWGILDAYGLTGVLYADTVIHFLAMSAAVMFWTQYVIDYLNQNNTFEKVLKYMGQFLFVFAAVVIVINFFFPIMFWFDENGVYQAGPARYALLGIQIFMFLMTSVYTLRRAQSSDGSDRIHYETIGFFGIAMVAMIFIQLFYPLLPFYSIGYMLGTTVLHSFIVEDEKEENRRELEESLAREQRQTEELKENREALKNALEHAEEASKAKTAFLSNMSHEIRTPMNAIIGLNNIAMNDPTASDKVKEYMQKIDVSAQHLLGIINEILDMSRIESGRMTIRKEEFSFARMLEQINSVISSQCREKGITYECVINGSVDDYYIGDSTKLVQVLLNILGNAVKFTPKGGSIKFTIEEAVRYDGKVTLKFTVSDTGIGMSEEFLPHIFDAFSQEDSSSTSKYGSTGLGMPITKSIVELMNGHIDVESEKGKGSTFTVTVTLDESDRRETEAHESEIDPYDLSVLVIDDDPVALEYATIVLGQIGVSVETASSGQEGVEKVSLRHARRDDYDLILVDWRMPEMDGVETSRQIRSVVGQDTPIIILTSFNWDEVAEEAKEAGVDTFVAKPLFANNVMDEFREAFRRKNEKLVRETADLKGRRVLLAEDMAVNAEIMMMVLNMREMECDLAENGKIAVDLFASHEPGYYDAILMDMRMPEMDGLEATRAIRAMDREDAATIPIIALTANAFDEDVQRSMQAGLNAHLSKPVEPDVLFETLEGLLS